MTCILEEMTIGKVEALDSEVVVFGLRSTEPYGPHLAHGTDVFQTEVVCRHAVECANERGANVLI